MRIDEFKELVRTAAQPSSVDIIRAKQLIVELLADGLPHKKGDLVDALARAEGLHGARAVVSGSREMSADSVDGRHPSILYCRYHFAGEEALGDLVTQGIVLASYSSSVSIPFEFQHGGRQHGPTDVSRSAPRLDSEQFRLPSALRDIEALSYLDNDLFTASLNDLSLPEPTHRALQEGLAAFRRGLYLSSAAMLGAVVEYAWIAAGQLIASTSPRLARSIEEERTAEVQRLVTEQLRGTKGVRESASDLLAFAHFARRLRNFGAHPVASDDKPIANHLNEVGCGLLILQTHVHLSELGSAVTAWRQEHDTSSGQA